MENIKDIKPCFEIEKDGTTYVCMGTFNRKLEYLIVEYGISRIKPYRCSATIGFHETPRDVNGNYKPYIDRNETIFFIKDEWVNIHSEISLPETHEYCYTLHEDEYCAPEFDYLVGVVEDQSHSIYSEKNESWITNSHPDYQYTLRNSTTLHVARLKEDVDLEPESEPRPESEPKRPASALYTDIITAIQNHSNNNGEYDINLLRILDLIKNSL